MNIRRTLSAAAVATGLAATVLVAAPATQASAAFSQCAVGKFCLFENPDGSGNPFTDSTAPLWDENLHNNNFGDKATVVWNRTGAFFCLYKDVNFGGDILPIRIPPNMTGPVSLVPQGWGRIASSYSIVRSDHGCTPKAQ